MQVVINVPEKIYEMVMNTGTYGCYRFNSSKAIREGIPLPKGNNGMIDYRRAFKIACDLLNGDVMFGVDAEKIFEVMMDKNDMVTSTSYEEYILNHLQELDHGQYAER